MSKGDTLEITATEEAGRFRLKGELDLATEPRLTGVLEDAVRQGVPIVLEVSELSFMDSTGLRTILRAAGAMSAIGALVLVRPSPAVRRVLEISLPEGAPGLRVED